ncbi:MAG: hypothetical protein AABZ12_12850 [Planctomycetota bacterium]
MAQVITETPGPSSNLPPVRTSIEAAVAVTAASGQSASFDTYPSKDVALVAELTALAGGTSPTVTFSWQHSADGTTWYAAATEAALSAAGVKQRTTRDNLMRYLRVGWATTGTPTTATATFTMQAR